MDFELIDLLLKGGISTMGAFFLYMINAMKRELKDLTSSVNQLNVSMAQYMERTSSLDKRVTKLEQN